MSPYDLSITFGGTLTQTQAHILYKPSFSAAALTVKLAEK